MRSAVALSLIFLAGCSRESTTLRAVHLPSQIAVSKPQFATQRFLPTNSADVAFDTKTGSLCRTWDWHDPEGTPYPKGMASQTSTCDRLYQYDIEQQAALARR